MYIKIEQAKGIVMSYCQKSMIQRFSELDWEITEDYIIDLTCEIVDVLHEVHSHGIIHCDLKPENIMFDEDEEVQLIDFSFSRFIDKEHKDSATQNNSAFEGTVYYSARLKMGNFTSISLQMFTTELFFKA